MSMITHVVGFHAPDDKYSKMAHVWRACEQAGVDAPEEVQEYFGWAPPRSGPEISEKDLLACGAIRPYKAEMQEGFDLLVDRLPAGVKIVRFVNSW